jgi:O-methyltransferase
MYQSTMDILEPLYPRVSPGGFVIVDDYWVIAACRQAVDEYRDRHGITNPILEIDGSGVFWQVGPGT